MMTFLRNILIIAALICAAWASEAYLGKSGREKVRVVGKHRTEAVSSAGNYGFSYRPNKGGVAIGDQDAQSLVTVTVDNKPFDVTVPEKAWSHYYKGQYTSATVRRGLFTHRVIGCVLE